MARSSVARAALLATGVAAASLAWACLRPTQITLDVTTDVACDRVRGTSIYGAAGDAPASDPITTTSRCESGASRSAIGTLVVTPAGDKSGRASLAVVLGVDRPSESCAAAGYKGCVVARRRLSFVPHEPLALPIALDRACLDVPCDDTQTCVGSRCVSAEVDPNDPCKNGLCGTPPVDGGRDSAPDVAAVTGAPLVINTGGLLVRGVTASPTHLFFSQAQTRGFVIQSVPWSDLTAAPTQFQSLAIDTPAWGIAYSDSPPALAVAGTFPSHPGEVFAVSVGDVAQLPPQYLYALGAGVGIAALGSQSWLVTGPDYGVSAVSTTTSNGAGTTTPAFSGYVDRFGSDAQAFVGVRGGVAVITLANDAVVLPAGNAFPTLVVPASAGDTVGVAVSAGYVYVSTTSQALFSIRRSDGATQRMPFTVPTPQDLYYRPSRQPGGIGEIYVGGAAGIYRIPALD